MPLAPGTRIGPYEVSGVLGAGGMGEVYRAHDLKLNRDVALKILPETVANDPDRLSRFRREAQVLAALNHPHIAQIYGFEDSGGRQALAMELVDGLTLEDLIGKARSGLPRADALSIAGQIALALEAAHDQGIIHRDLKPANIKVRPDGTVKVLDFGLAKALDPSAATSPEAMNSPTLTSPALTERGVILGTAAYMAPEQARGKTVDKRADIWAFGVLLYEMITGARAFQGEGLSDTLAAVVRHEIDWRRLPSDTPPGVRTLLARCLEPDPKQRLRDIGEARVALSAVARGDREPAAMHDVPARSPLRRERLAWTVAVIAVLTAVTIGAWQTFAGPAESAGAAADVARLSVLPPPGSLMNADSTNTAISPNGRLVAFVVGVGVSTENQLWVRPIDSSVARRIESGDGISQPFWSPDSERIGFFASRKLKTVPAAGGPATIVCDAPFGRGATWNASNVIVFAPDPTGPLYRVPGGGGTPTPATTLDTTRKEDNHRFPAFLPDGDHFLFAALPGADGVFQIFAGSLQDPRARTAIGSMESAPVYANPGWLLFTRQGVLTAQPFDAKALKTIGDAITLGDEPTIAQTTAAYDAGRRVSVSTTGSLAFYFEPSTNTRLQWMDPNAKVAGVVSVPPARYSSVTIAPDGTRAVLVRSDSQISSSLWLADLRRDSFVPILMNANKNPLPVWSPDSTRIAFQGERDGRRGLYEKTVDEAAGEVRILPVDNNSIFPRGWSKDRGIIFNQIDPGTKWNIYLVPASGRGAPALLVGGPSIEVGGWPSPDNHWLAYQSDEAGSLDLWVQPFPGPGTRTHVVAGGIQASWWMPDGRHLLYLKRDRSLWQVEVDFRIVPAKIGAPVQLATFPSALVEMDLAPDGRRFLALVPEQAGLGAVTVVERWQAALRAKR